MYSQRKADWQHRKKYTETKEGDLKDLRIEKKVQEHQLTLLHIKAHMKHIGENIHDQ